MSCRIEIHLFVGTDITIPQEPPAEVWDFAVADVGAGVLLTSPADKNTGILNRNWVKPRNVLIRIRISHSRPCPWILLHDSSRTSLLSLQEPLIY